MNKEAAHKLGELIIALSSRVSYVKLAEEKNLLHGNYLKLQCYIIHGEGRKVHELGQLITEDDILRMSDPEAMADAIADKIRADAGITRKRT